VTVLPCTFRVNRKFGPCPALPGLAQWQIDFPHLPEVAVIESRRRSPTDPICFNSSARCFSNRSSGSDIFDAPLCAWQADQIGSAAFTMVVRDLNAAGEQWTRAHGTVATTSGKPIVRANGAGNVFVRDVSGLMWELIQSAAQ
jgi:hypothetical protein